MQPATLPLEIYRGDSVRLRVKLWDQGQQPIDLTGVVAKSEIRDRPAGTQVTAFTCVITLPNIIDLTLSAIASRQLPTHGVWDLQLTYSTGEVNTPIGGPVTITADVTDSTPVVPAPAPVARAR